MKPDMLKITPKNKVEIKITTKEGKEVIKDPSKASTFKEVINHLIANTASKISFIYTYNYKTTELFKLETKTDKDLVTVIKFMTLFESINKSNKEEN